jgi:hypothetical protein
MGWLAWSKNLTPLLGRHNVSRDDVMQAIANPFFTIGHSTRSVDEFIHLLRQAEVELVVDVRRILRSATKVQP